MVLPWLIDPFFPGTPVRDWGERRREKIKKQEEKTAKIRERALERRREFLFGKSGGINPEYEQEEVQQKGRKPPIPRRLRGIGGPLAGAELGIMAGSFGAKQEGRIAGGSFMDLYTPSIRRYEETAFAGMGGKVI